MVKFTIYCGLNDKITCKQIIETESRLQITKNIVVNNIGFGTISLANGVYTMNDNKMIVSENTIRIEICDVDFHDIQIVCSQLRDSFNQESVLIEKSEIETMYD